MFVGMYVSVGHVDRTVCVQVAAVPLWWATTPNPVGPRTLRPSTNIIVCNDTYQFLGMAGQGIENTNGSALWNDPSHSSIQTRLSVWIADGPYPVTPVRRFDEESRIVREGGQG